MPLKGGLVCGVFQHPLSVIIHAPTAAVKGRGYFKVAPTEDKSQASGVAGTACRMDVI